jgi:hypothetical protein
MPLNPGDTGLVTIPGGIILFFDDGTGERDLGNVDISSMSIEPKTTELAFESQRSGISRVADIFSLKEECTIKVKLQEAVVQNLQAFFKGGPVTPVTAGTAAVVDQPLTLTGEKLISVGQYGLTAVTVKNLAGDHTYVHNADYVIDAGSGPPGMLVGKIGRIEGGDITTGQMVLVSYTHVTWASLKFALGKSNFLRGTIRMQFHPDTGLQGNLSHGRVLLKADGAMSFDPKKEFQVPLVIEWLDNSASDPDFPYGYWESLDQ